MNTVPKIGLSKLAALRGRERMFHVAWGAARWLTLAAVVIAVSTFIDWRIDKYRETPFALRLLLTAAQAVGLGIAGWFWLVKPWARGPSIVRLARRVEEQIPEFGHRLVTSIQLSEKRAKIGGMSPELIERVSRESEAIADKHSFTQFADKDRLQRAAITVLAPLALTGLLVFLYGPTLFGVLLKRQLLASAEIPRFNQLENITPELWPAGDEVTVEYIVSGKIEETDVGRLRVKPDDLPADDYKLAFARRLDDNRTVFAFKVPHSSIDFEHRAWVGDGRTRTASRVRFEPRPVITRTDAWVQLPRFLGNKPDGKPYETYQAQGEITGLANQVARVKIGVQKPISEAKVVLISRSADGTAEVDKATHPMTPGAEEESPTGEKSYPAETTFDLTPDLIGYRVIVRDRNGFENAVPPRRGIQISADDPPTVRLLPERYGEFGTKASDEDIIEGLPVPLGGQIPIAYTCRSPQGVMRAQLRYRVNEKGPWIPLPLTPVQADEKTGPFDPNRGAFVNTQFGQQVEFHMAPSADRESAPDFLTGGGRFDFQIAELTKVTDEGTPAKLEIGDRVEFYVEVFDRNPTPNRKPGRSETRMKEVLTAAEVLARLDQTRQAEGKIRDLEKRQRDVFTRPKD
ncbi:MAG TPA: hypothetical protein VM597_41180 [Gemmataceae bacterium]|nr:hypothetical protein [Gemmataceae bacterium]